MQSDAVSAESLLMSSSDQRELGRMDELMAAFAADVVPAEASIPVPAVEALIPLPPKVVVSAQFVKVVAPPMPEKAAAPVQLVNVVTQAPPKEAVAPEAPVAVSIPAPRQSEPTQPEAMVNEDSVDLPALYRELRSLEFLPPTE
jgi:hypothetical protein